jgi:hypothetical protein
MGAAQVDNPPMERFRRLGRLPRPAVLALGLAALARFAYADAGLSLPRTSRQQWSADRHVQVADLRPGTWSSGPTTRPTRRPSTMSACTSARA